MLAAADDYLRSLPLAARLATACFSRIACRICCLVGCSIHRYLSATTERDMEPGGSTYAGLGRYHSPQLLELLARLDADIFITGHTAGNGWR